MIRLCCDGAVLVGDETGFMKKQQTRWGATPVPRHGRSTEKPEDGLTTSLARFRDINAAYF